MEDLLKVMAAGVLLVTACIVIRFDFGSRKGGDK